MLTLAIVPNELPGQYRMRFRDKLLAAASRFEQERKSSGYRIPYATDRYNWGSNSNLLNRAIILLVAFQLSDNHDFRNAAIDVMDYLLGRNPLDQSYISGYGERPMQYPHHRFWAPGFDAGLPPPPPGALSGGPNSTAPADEVARQMAGKCAPQRCWADRVEAYALNEVAINWNAPLVWVAAVLASGAGN
jgi:endoglucanase